MRVFITGVNGFIGKALAARLRADGARGCGMDLVGVDDVVAGDVAVAGPWQDAAAGADLVIHTAAVVSLRLERPDEVWAANVLGTAHVVDAAERAGASRFVHFSSVTTFGFDFPDGVDERYPVHTTGVPYPDTKIASEQVVLQAHLDDRVPCTIVRPGDVYGPGSRAWAVLPVESLKAHKLVLPRGGIFSPVHVDDLVRGVAAAAGADAGAGQVFTLSGGVGVPNEEFFGVYADAVGTTLRTLPLPVLKTLSRIVQQASRLQSGDNDINPRAAEYLARSGTYSIAKAERVLGWRPEVDVAVGLAARSTGCAPPATSESLSRNPTPGCGRRTRTARPRF